MVNSGFCYAKAVHVHCIKRCSFTICQSVNRHAISIIKHPIPLQVKLTRPSGYIQRDAVRETIISADSRGCNLRLSIILINFYYHLIWATVSCCTSEKIYAADIKDLNETRANFYVFSGICTIDLHKIIQIIRPHTKR